MIIRIIFGVHPRTNTHLLYTVLHSIDNSQIRYHLITLVMYQFCEAVCCLLYLIIGLRFAPCSFSAYLNKYCFHELGAHTKSLMHLRHCCNIIMPIFPCCFVVKSDVFALYIISLFTTLTLDIYALPVSLNTKLHPPEWKVFYRSIRVCNVNWCKENALSINPTFNQCYPNIML